MKSKGLGDSIQKVTKATGLQSFANVAARMVGAKDCGCIKRKEWLNKKFPYKQYK